METSTALQQCIRKHSKRYLTCSWERILYPYSSDGWWGDVPFYIFVMEIHVAHRKVSKSSAKDVSLPLTQCFANLLVDGNFYSWSIYYYYTENTWEMLRWRLLTGKRGGLDCGPGSAVNLHFSSSLDFSFLSCKRRVLQSIIQRAKGTTMYCTCTLCQALTCHQGP